jgi:hypothetical protein
MKKAGSEEFGFVLRRPNGGTSRIREIQGDGLYSRDLA